MNAAGTYETQFGLAPNEMEFEYEYDEFLGKIVRKIKEKQPIRRLLGIKKPSSNSPAPKVPSAATQQAQIQQREREAELARKNQELQEQIKSQEELEARASAAEQEAMDSQGSDSKKMLLFGLLAVGALAIIGGAVVLIKTRQNQLRALQMQALD